MFASHRACIVPLSRASLSCLSLVPLFRASQVLFVKMFFGGVLVGLLFGKATQLVMASTNRYRVCVLEYVCTQCVCSVAQR